jgi:cytidylate kinase
MAIIAMSRELGSWGTLIGTAVANDLGYEYIYQDITSEAARDYEVVEEQLIRVVERAPGFLEKLKGDFRRYQAFVQAQVYKAAQKDNVVLIGRWSTLLLKDVSHALRVRVIAPDSVRARRVMEMMQVGMDKAMEMVRENDLERGGRMEHLYGVDWKASHLYDLVLSTEKVSVRAAAEAIATLARREEYRATEDSKRKLDDLVLASSIRAELKTHRSTRDAEVDIRAGDGDVMLMGVVLSDAESKAVEKTARRVKGVRKLENHLNVLRHPPR